ncbi:16S rRNA (cytidine(1402)-2'-O)-methyltransferase [Tepidamorphus sp. 3E244]|uniref:16S rRNA (cytidine(1402)-2'-O)-methyltransferase n=1 Tax=Tepidamorphus sp. 3E244 TaxID=3385498 RepID=UPI0038FC2478
MLQQGYAIGQTAFPAPRPASGLYVVATPIGNLKDVTIRALETLAAADVIACEDTRHTRRLLDHYAIRTHCLSYHEHNAAQRRPELLDRLAGGQVVALVSDAGTPLVSDPGFKLVEAVIEAGHAVFPLPGASATLAALVAAGLPTDSFFFAGFLPSKSGARRNKAAEFATVPGTLVFYESPNRVAAMLADMQAVYGDRQAAVARELTKRFETLERGTLGELAQRFGEGAAPKGEIVVVVAPPDEEAPSADIGDDAIAERLESLSAEHGVSRAAQILAQETGLPRKKLYTRALELGSRARKAT